MLGQKQLIGHVLYMVIVMPSLVVPGQASQCLLTSKHQISRLLSISTSTVHVGYNDRDKYNNDVSTIAYLISKFMLPIATKGLVYSCDRQETG